MIIIINIILVITLIIIKMELLAIIILHKIIVINTSFLSALIENIINSLNIYKLFI